MIKHPCKIIVDTLDEKPFYGDTEGVCRITGEKSKGMPFQKWVKKTFTDTEHLHSGDIISNEALFTFQEKSDILKDKTDKEKPQRFRNYSHFVVNGEWFAFTKANKGEMKRILLSEDPELAVMSESGQRHLLFKSKPMSWQLEDAIIKPDKERLGSISNIVDSLYGMGFTQEEVRTGRYNQHKIVKAGLKKWKGFEDKCEQERGSVYFDLAMFLITKKEIKDEQKQTEEEGGQGRLF